MNTQQTRMYKRALAAHPGMTYPGVKTQWEDCFTTDDEYLFFWFNDATGSTRTLREPNGWDLYTSTSNYLDCPNCGLEEAVEVPATDDGYTPRRCDECGATYLVEYDGDYTGDHWQQSVSLKVPTGAVPGKEGERT